MKTTYKPNKIGNQELTNLIAFLKNKPQNRKYSCIMSVSGGMDSSHLFYLGAVKWNLNLAVLHINDGFNSEITMQNIQNLSQSTNIDFIEIKPDPDQYNDLLLTYLKAGA